MVNKTKGVLLLNLGGPEALDAVRPFLYNLFSDRDIIRLGPAVFQKPLAWFISTMRTKKTRSAYALIGGGSPINRITKEQADSLESALKPHGDFKVYTGMRYWHPFIEDTVRRMTDEGIQDCIALSLYPHYSTATTGSAYKELESCLQKYRINCTFTDAWYNNPYYIDSVFNTVSELIDNKETKVDILYSAHSLPVSFVESGDPYVNHIEETVRLVNARLTESGFIFESHLAYQSRSGPVKWLEPSTDEKIKDLASKGVTELITVPISFVSDHIETLYEIDMLYKDLASENGIILRRVESLNTNPTFIDALKDIVLRYC